MTVLNILKYPEKSLLEPSEPVEIINGQVDKKINTLIADMGETMFKAPGVGLAAPQVGVNKRVIIYDAAANVSNNDDSDNQDDPEKNSNEEKIFKAIINPEIIKKSGSIISENEACLSVPDLSSNVKRYETISVTGTDQDGNLLEFDTDGIFAIILQHEIDHLDGILFFERISLLKKKMYKKRITKKQQET